MPDRHPSYFSFASISQVDKSIRNGTSSFMKPFVIATLLMFQAAAHAGLQWEKKELEFRADASAGEVKAEFNFTNTGDGPVTIESVQSSCGCTTAVLDKKTYQ